MLLSDLSTNRVLGRMVTTTDPSVSSPSFAINEHLKTLENLRDAQHIFMHDHLSLINLSRVLNMVTEAVDDVENVDLCFFDLFQAFYVGNHRILDTKLRIQGL